MSTQIPNFGPAGSDPASDPQLLSVPLVIYDNGDMKFWYPEALEYSSANRMVFALDAGGNVAARVDVQLILPATEWIGCEPTSLHALRSQPIRLNLALDATR